MKIIPAGYVRIEEPDPIKKIERVACVCYKSEDKIGEDTDIKMVKNLIERKHLAMLEHANLALELDIHTYTMLHAAVSNLATDMHLYSGFLSELRFTQFMLRNIVSGNLRAWQETLTAMVYNEMEIPTVIAEILRLYSKGLIAFMGTPSSAEAVEVKVIKDFTSISRRERMRHETMTILFTVDRGVTHELVRHRRASFAQESTRYCNYGNKDKDITVIEPIFFDPDSLPHDVWESACKNASDAYMGLTNGGGVLPQEARTVLPQSVKADIVVTATLEEWMHIFNLRACDSTGPAHPQMKEVMIPLLKDAKQWYPGIFDNLTPASMPTRL